MTDCVYFIYLCLYIWARLCNAAQIRYANRKLLMNYISKRHFLSNSFFIHSSEFSMYFCSFPRSMRDICKFKFLSLMPLTHPGCLIPMLKQAQNNKTFFGRAVFTTAPPQRVRLHPLMKSLKGMRKSYRNKRRGLSSYNLLTGSQRHSGSPVRGRKGGTLWSSETFSKVWRASGVWCSENE